ncbi:MAG TPA: flagellar basal-body MS-ring/collar protein FliF [Buchnera sp. (in: enterobacteria)]|nr:flagellar basal-body MS-ring/collar protein FliF [Buchnera sp. (in: enterobacteria)]
MNLQKNINTDNQLKDKKIFNNVLNRYYINSKVLIILIILLITVIISTSIWVKPKQYSVLYNRLSDKDIGSIVSQLIKMNIPYKFNDTSGVLLVPKNKINEIRFYLAKHGLPKGSGIGFELLDKEKFGISQFNEKINYQRALEGELARTIERLNVIKFARVHIAFPKFSLFVHEKKEPTASIILDLQPGQCLDRRQTNAILYFIASSVSGLTPDHITIVDQFGHLLNNLDFFNNEVNDMHIRYTEAIEKKYKKRIEDILSPILGLNNIRAQVTAQIDFNNQDKTEEKYKPNFDNSHKAIRSYQSTHNINSGSRNLDILIPDDSLHTSSNISKNNSNHVKDLQISDSSKLKDTYVKKNNNKLDKRSYFFDNAKSYHDDIINYELDHTILHTKINIGKIKRLSTAVVVNFIKNEQGKSIPISMDLIKNINSLTRQAVGYSKERGDTVNIVNSLFLNDIDMSKISNLTPFNIDQHYFKNDKNINNTYKKENNIKQYFMWQDLIKSNFLLRISPFIILLLLCFILLQFFIFIKKIRRYKSLYIKIMNEQKNIIAQQVGKKNITHDVNIKKTSNDLLKNNSHIIEKIVREWMSDKKL